MDTFELVIAAQDVPRYWAPPFTWYDPDPGQAVFFYSVGLLLLAAMAFQGATAARRARQGRLFAAGIARANAFTIGQVTASLWALAAGFAMGCGPDQEDPAIMAILVGLALVVIVLGVTGVGNLVRRIGFWHGKADAEVGPPKPMTIRDAAVIIAVGACVFLVAAVLTRLLLGGMYTS